LFLFVLLPVGNLRFRREYTAYARDIGNNPMASTEDKTDWPEAMATVTACRYDVRAGRALAFGLTSKKHFRIAYNYWAGDALHTGECFSEAAMPQGTLFPIHYNPDLPHEHRNTTETPSRLPLIAFGIAGSIVLSLAWLLLMRGCS
jgi:hypothetical protein